jgi:hypothetical protein
MTSIPRLALLCATALVSCAAQAQAPSSDVGYEVTRSQTVANAPAGYVGRKTTDHETRVGNTPDTDGNSSTFAMTIGGFVRECPTAEGSVAGTFEYSLTSDEVDTDHGETERKHHAVKLVVDLEGHTRDDGLLDYVDVRGEFTRQLHGMPAERRSVSTRFALGAQGQPDVAAMQNAVLATGDLSIAVEMWLGSTIYTDAQNVWNRPNACVEITFDPPTETRFLGPNGSADVRVVLRTKEEKAPIGDVELEVQAIQAIGTVSPRKGRPDAGTPFTTTYTASADPKDSHGVEAFAKQSHAGPGYGTWKIRAAVPYEGTFTQSAKMTATGADVPGPLGAGAQRYGMGASSDYETTGRVLWTPEEKSSRAGSFGEVASAFLVPTDGEIRVDATGEGHSVAGRCTHKGGKTFAIRDLPPEALQYTLLEIAADGRYKLWLGMVSYFLQFQVEGECDVVGGKRMRQTLDVNEAGIVIGQQEGVLVGDAISGATAAPIVMGVHRYTGNWDFKKKVGR